MGPTASGGGEGSAARAASGPPRRSRRALLVAPAFPTSYWSMRYALEFVGKRANMPPLGLLTVAGMFPDGYELRLVDLNVEPLRDADLEWADTVFLSAMLVQKRSLHEVVERCRRHGIPTVAGGPYPTSYPESLAEVDHVVVGEAEGIFPELLRDLERGEARRLYVAPSRPSLALAPLPRFDLLRMNLYESMVVQFSRGCPFNCEFCDITTLFGRVPRTKSNEQVIAELQRLHDLGWRGSVFVVDDNFIGNKRDAMRLLPALADWQRPRGYPFRMHTEASVNLAELDSLMQAMTEAGFFRVFLGIETPNPQVLVKAGKGQNVKRGHDDYLLRAVRKIQCRGLQVSAGFILGMDGDTEASFDAQIAFIQEAGIPMAMVGLLTALKGTRLYHRLGAEGRLLEESSGNNVEVALNFEPEMERTRLEKGYLRVLSTLYDPSLRNYFDRCWRLLRTLGPRHAGGGSVGWVDLRAFARSLRRQLLSRQGPAYARLLLRVLLRRPRLLPDAVTLAVFGYHFERVTREHVASHRTASAPRSLHHPRLGSLGSSASR